MVSYYTGGHGSQLRGNDEDNSSGENGVHHLHGVRLLLEPVHRRAAIRYRRHSAATRTPASYDSMLWPIRSSSSSSSSILQYTSIFSVSIRRWTHRAQKLFSTGPQFQEGNTKRCKEDYLDTSRPCLPIFLFLCLCLFLLLLLRFFVKYPAMDLGYVRYSRSTEVIMVIMDFSRSFRSATRNEATTE